MMKKMIFALSVSAAAMTAAQAQTTVAPRPYIGVGVAVADQAGGDEGYKANAKVFGGVELNQNWAAEAGYTDFRKSDMYVGEGSSIVKGSAKGYGLYLAGKYTMPINDQFSAYGKLGVSNSRRNVSTVTGTSYSKYDTGAYAAVGVQYNLNQNVALVGEYERYGKDKAFGTKADVWTAGLKYSF
jgi:OOP family OmpA-OmpF porin